MVPPLFALFIMEPLSLPNQREPCKVEKIALVPPSPFKVTKLGEIAKGQSCENFWGDPSFFTHSSPRFAPSYIVEKLPH